MSGKPTSAAKSRTSSPERAPVERGAADAGGAQHLLHRRLVAAEEGRAHRGAGDAAGLAHVRRGHHVGLDRGLEPVDPTIAAAATARRRPAGPRRRPTAPARSGVSQPLTSSSSQSFGRSPMPMTVAPTSCRARANCFWLSGKLGSRKTTFTRTCLCDAPCRAVGAIALMRLPTAARPAPQCPEYGPRRWRTWSSSRRTRSTRRRASSTPWPRCPTPGSVSSAATRWSAFPTAVRRAIAGHWRTDDCLDADQLAGGRRRAARRTSARSTGCVGHPREPAGAAGRGARAARHRRHRRRGRRQLPRQGADEGGVRAGRRAVRPAAGGSSPRDDVPRFAAGVGFPFVAKPLAGAGARNTFRIDDAEQLERVARRRRRRPPTQPMLLEEFVTGRRALLRQRRHRRSARLALDQPLPADSARRAREPMDPVVRAAAARHRRAEYADIVETVGDRAVTALGPADRVVAHGVVPPARRLASPSPRSAPVRPARSS